MFSRTYYVYISDSTWIESLVVARKLQIFYNIADEAQVQYEKSGIYFTKVLHND